VRRRVKVKAARDVGVPGGMGALVGVSSCVPSAPRRALRRLHLWSARRRTSSAQK
jgi:hypothetical protein